MMNGLHWLQRLLFSGGAAMCVLLATACTPQIDTDGGYRVTYSLRSPYAPADQEAAVEVLQRRLDVSGLRGSQVKKYGADKIEITLPGIDAAHFELVQEFIVTPGRLEFRILAQRGTHDALIAAATEAPPGQNAGEKPVEKSAREQAVDEQAVDEQAVGDKPSQVANAATEWVRFNPADVNLPAEAVQRTVKKSPEREHSEVLVVIDTNNVDSRLLVSVNKTVTSNGQPAVAGRFSVAGAQQMRALVSGNLPRGNVSQLLGVVLDDRLIVAPRIQAVIAEAFMMTGDFTEQEVDYLVGVLQAGRLPVELDRETVNVVRVEPKH